MKKIIILFIIIILTGFGFWFYKSKIETVRVANNQISLEDISDWKTYTNKERGFEIQYPKDWHSMDFKEKNIGGIITNLSNPAVLNSKKLPPLNDDLLYLEVALDEGENQQSFSEFISRIKTTSVEDLIIGGSQAYKIKATKNTYFWAVINQKTGEVFLIIPIIVTSDLYSRDYEKYKDLFEKIISTFKFIY